MVRVQEMEHEAIFAAARANLQGASEFCGEDYSGISSDTLQRAARCAQILLGDRLADWTTDAGAAAGLIACFMQGAIDARIKEAE